MLAKYYDHNPVWNKRQKNNHPVWGSYSTILYQRVLHLFEKNELTTMLYPHLFDFGCGAGKFGEMVEKYGYKYTGLDDSSAAIKLGKETWKQMSLFECDLAAAPLPKQWHHQADIGTALNSLHCLTEESHRDQFIANMFQAIRPGGILFVSTMVGPVNPGYRPSENPRLYLDPKQVKAELSRAGFGPEICSEVIPASGVNAIPNLEILLERP